MVERPMIEFTNLTSKPIRRAKFEKLYRTTMPKNFALSVVFAPPSLMRKLNKTYRKKDQTANVISFLLDKNISEIFLNSNEKNLFHLFVHGCLHVLGYGHKTTKKAMAMEKKEQLVLRKVCSFLVD